MEKFTYFHCYAEDLWEGYEKNGLLRDNFGIRFMQCIRLPEELKFNEYAKKGGKLYNFIKEHNCAFYIDRLQGGTFLEEYDFDTDLIDEYKQLLGDKFLGFQMHEWLSNYKTEIHWKLTDLPEEKWTKENIEKFINEKFPLPWLFLEPMTLDELAYYGKPKTPQEFYNNMTDVYRKRAEKYPLVPCSSWYMMYPFEAENGAKVIMPEVGWQIPGMRVQMCYARGVCSAYGITLGAYYEPWGGEPFTTCSYSDDGKNEWLNKGSKSFPFVPGGPNGGSSRSMQWRVHLYAYLSGAKMISEEWGGYNTFKNRETYELSEYGLVKKRFLDFVDKYSDIGEKLAPIAAVVSNDLLCYTTSWNLENDSKELFGYKLEGEALENNRKLLFAVDKIFGRNVPMYGNETLTLVNSTVPDGVDMLNEGDGKALSKYRYLVNLTGDAFFKDKYANCISPEEVSEKLDELLPCKVTGGLHYLVNRRGKEGYYLAIFNHSGVVRTQKKGDEILPEATVTVTVELKDSRALKALEGSKEIIFKDGKYYVTVSGGDWFFAEF
ncbi:MAG: hypothetical protein J6M35_09910 [Clostridia bacterium]|nr:hypothetical protein [Clostridia bacterium]